MNAGAAAANGSYLLFLHADSIFDDPNALRMAIDALCSAMVAVGHERVAGRFALRFRHHGEKPSLFYYYHECKARLDRGECVHGDQGFFLHRSFFSPFEETIPVLEDTLFAGYVDGRGAWILFPSDICTSARRFEMEGRAKREILNAMVMTLSAVGCEYFLCQMPRAYDVHDRTGRLRLYPFFNRIRQLLKVFSLRERTRFWHRCGSYAVANTWQIAYFLDVWRNFSNGFPPGKGPATLLRCFDRYLTGVPGNSFIRISAASLVCLWFYAMLVCGYAREKIRREGATL
jgi:hypothetical protein